MTELAGRTKIGERRHYGLLERRGAAPEEWVPQHQVWAKIEPMAAATASSPGPAMPPHDTRITVPYVAGVTHQNSRFRYEDRIFDIKKVVDPEERHIELILFCNELIPVVDVYGEPADR